MEDVVIRVTGETRTTSSPDQEYVSPSSPDGGVRLVEAASPAWQGVPEFT
jgi:hypothetical protein